MPIYEYRRPDGTTFEIQQRFSEEALSSDPDTGVPVERVLHAPAVHFKGKGFYNTDYGTRKRERESGAAGEASPSPDGASPGGDSADGSGGDPSAGSSRDSDAKRKHKDDSPSGPAKASKPVATETR
jgi:predicted nucleic acid-binding Zn ribbon protein